MRRTLAFKLFIGLTLGNLLVMALAALAFAWQLNQGFDRYLLHASERRMAHLAQELGEWYSVQGSFALLANHPILWRQWLDAEHFDWGQKDAGKQDDPRGDSVRRLPLALYDVNGRRIVGEPIDKPLRTEPIWSDGELAGVLMLGAPPQEAMLRSAIERDYAASALRLLAGFALCLLLASLILTAWATRRINLTLSQFGQAIHRLAQGIYQPFLPRQSTAELDRLAADINQLGVTLAAHQSKQERWLADIAHELRTPLAILRGELEALRDGVRVLDAAGIDSLLAEAGRLNRLISDLRQLALLDQGELDIDPQACDVAQTVAVCLRRNTARLQAQGLQLEQNLANGCFARLDQDRFLQCLDNLASNTLRYTEPPGTLRVRVWQQNNQICLRWEDTSPAVATADIPLLGQRLFRPDASRSRATGGSGLGLAIARSIVMAHGGSMTAATSTLGGLAWDIVLPAAAPDFSTDGVVT